MLKRNLKSVLELTSTCLVNGNMSANFCEEHLPAIMRSIENDLSRCGLTVQDINHAVSDMLTSSSSLSSDRKNVIVCDSEVQLTITSDADTESTQQSTLAIEPEYIQQSMIDVEPEFTQASLVDAEPEHTQQCTIDTDLLTKQNVNSLLEDLQKTVSRLENTLDCFISKTYDQFSLLRDEICSVKRHSKVYHEHTDRHIEDVDQSTKQLKTTFEKINDITFTQTTGHLRRCKSQSLNIHMQQSTIDAEPEHTQKSTIDAEPEHYLQKTVSRLENTI